MGVFLNLALESTGEDPAASIAQLGDLIDQVGRVVHLPEA
jgi:hypothetical protein